MKVDTSPAIMLPRLEIPVAVWLKIMAYISTCDTEINGFGLVDVPAEDGVIRVQDAFIVQQEATPVFVETDQLALARYLTDMVRQGGDTAQVRFQWHSHVNMSAYFSGVDVANINRWNGPWLVSMVANKAGECSCRLDVFHPYRLAVRLQPRVILDIPQSMQQAVADEVRAKVHRKSLGIRRAAKTQRPAATHLLDPDLLVDVNQEEVSDAG